MSQNLIRISAPTFGSDVEDLVLAVLRSGQIAQGPMVLRFEDLCAEMSGTAYAVAVANGTVALEAAFESLGIGPGDEVITTPLTFAATVNAAIRTGATVRFADVTDDYTIDPGSVGALVNDRTAAIVPVHLYGLPADMPALIALANRHGLAVIEDAAQAHGAVVAGRRAGAFGLGCFSFYATKNVTSGEGGVITTSDESLARRLRLLRNQGMVERYHYELVGRNLRMTDLHAAVAIPQLERLPELNKARETNARQLSDRLRAAGCLHVPVVPDGRTHVWHQFTVLIPEGVDRDATVHGLRRRGVEAGVYYPRLAWDYPVYRTHPGVVTDPTPRAEAIARRCMSLPVHPGLSEHEIDAVADAVLDLVVPDRQ
jgi:dTDP-4-amino-4,6-dideoxygalactose transaminase